jgi:hypothetical protein
MAEGVGFEPTSRCRETVFKTAAFDHSAIPPNESKFLPSVAVKRQQFSMPRRPSKIKMLHSANPPFAGGTIGGGCFVC